jgi:hypothetical protein
MRLDRGSSGSLAWLPGHSPSIPISQPRSWVQLSPPCLEEKKMRSVNLEMMIQKLGFSMEIVVQNMHWYSAAGEWKMRIWWTG